MRWFVPSYWYSAMVVPGEPELSAWTLARRFQASYVQCRREAEAVSAPGLGPFLRLPALSYWGSTQFIVVPEPAVWVMEAPAASASLSLTSISLALLRDRPWVT